MPEERNRRRARSFQHAKTWLRAFLGYHGTDGITRFCEDDLGGVSLPCIVDVLIHGSIVHSEKCDDPGVTCVVESYFQEEAALIVVEVHFVENEEVLTILSAKKLRESVDESDHAA